MGLTVCIYDDDDDDDDRLISSNPSVKQFLDQ